MHKTEVKQKLQVILIYLKKSTKSHHRNVISILKTHKTEKKKRKNLEFLNSN